MSRRAWMLALVLLALAAPTTAQAHYLPLDAIEGEGEYEVWQNAAAIPWMTTGTVRCSARGPHRAICRVAVEGTKYDAEYEFERFRRCHFSMTVRFASRHSYRLRWSEPWGTYCNGGGLL